MQRALLVVIAFLAVATGASGASARQPHGRILFVFSFENRLGRHANIEAVDPVTLRVTTVAPARVDSEDPAPSRDGTRLAFTRGFLEGGPSLGLYVSDARGRNAHRIAPFGVSPTWSPGGSRLGYVRNAHVVVLRRDGTHARQLAPADVLRVAWDPRGKWLLVARGFDGCCLQLMRPDGTGLRTVLRVPASEKVEHPKWSPNGRLIAYEHDVGCVGLTCGGGGQIEIATLDGSVRQSFDGFYPAWSPDGTAIAYATGEGVFVRSLADGSTRQVFPQPPETFGIAWAKR